MLKLKQADFGICAWKQPFSKTQNKTRFSAAMYVVGPSFSVEGKLHVPACEHFITYNLVPNSVSLIRKRAYQTRGSAVADKPPDARVLSIVAPLVNECDLLAEFFHFYLPSSHLTPSMSGIPSSYRVHIWYRYGKTRMAGLQCGQGRIMMDSVVWVQYINVTDTAYKRDRQTATSL